MYKKSEQLLDRALKSIPLASQTFSKSFTQYPRGASPFFIEKGKGGKVWDVDGNEYIDFVNSLAAVTLGYCDKDVDKAVQDQMKNGVTFSLPHILEMEVAEKLIEIIPCAEKVRFAKNGTDATSASIRIARAYTNKEHIAVCGYHGWQDWYIGSTTRDLGVPEAVKEHTHQFEYNNIESLEKIFQEQELACVIMEPLTILEPACYGLKNCKNKSCRKFCKRNFLSEVKKMAHHYGALLIFDEIITGFRFSLGGAQELTGVTPDLATFAKAISNAIPLSAVVGKKEYMSSLKKTFFSFTYGGDCIGLAAAKACIPKIEREKVPLHLDIIGKLLKDGFNNLAKSHKLEEYVECIGYPCRTIISFNGRGKYNDLEIKSYFQQELFRRGILWAAYHSLSWSHNEKDIKKTLKAFDEIMGLFKKIILTNLKLRNLIEGLPVRPVFRQVADFNYYTRKNNKL